MYIHNPMIQKIVNCSLQPQLAQREQAIKCIDYTLVIYSVIESSFGFVSYYLMA